jgi:predicted ATPase/DNA-binding CsgD family transcriptional regulator
LTPPSARSQLQKVPLAPFGDRDESSGLPALLTSLVGRERETASLDALLRDPAVRLATLTGVGGVGKTRLAVRVAEELTAEFADGVHFVPLAAIADAALVLPTVARALGLVERGKRSLIAQLLAFLTPRKLLLVLDNLEQVLPVGPALVELLAASPRVTVLTTSRAPLRVSGEHIFPVVPLGLPAIGAADHPALPPERLLEAVASSDAGRLFLVRAQAVDPGLRLTESNAAAIAAVCQRLEGLPLALELAAARSAVLTPAALLTRLERRLPLLVAGPRDQPARLRTMRAAIAWSYDLLSVEDQTAFRRLAVFAGGFPLEAAEVILVDDATGPPAIELIASLVEQSLVIRERPVAGSELMTPRYTMLETIREFALQQLVESGERDDIAARHARWCVDLAVKVRSTGRISQRRGLLTLEAEHPNLRAALAWLLEVGEAKTALHLAGCLAEFWLRHGHLTEGQAWLERALAADQSGPTVARAEALVGLTMVLWPRNQFSRGDQLLTEAETVARAASDTGAVAYVRLHQGYLAALRGDFALAMDRGQEALGTAGAIPQGFSPNAALWLLAHARLARGEDDRAAEHFDRLLAAARAGGDEISLSNALYGLAVIAQRRGATRQALASFVEAAAVCLGFGGGWAASHSLDGAAAAAVALGHPETAVRLFAAADALRRALGAAQDSSFAVDRQKQESALAEAREAFGADVFAATWAAGASLSLEKAVDAAMALIETETTDGVAAPTRGDPGARLGLSAREGEVLRRLTGGESDKEIAAALGITRRTASNHVAAILTKLGVPSRTAAAVIALRDGLI